MRAAHTLPWRTSRVLHHCGGHRRVWHGAGVADGRRWDCGRDQVRTYQAAVWCYEKAIAYQEQNRQERSRRTLGE